MRNMKTNVNLREKPAFALRPMKTALKLDQVGRLHDLSDAS